MNNVARVMIYGKVALGANEAFYGACGQDCGDSLNWW